jgi:hypothetical protein
MLQLDGRTLAFGCAGALIGAAIVGTAWVVVSMQHEPEPAWRHTQLYDECLAHGRSITTCDAMMRVIATRDQQAHREAEEERAQTERKAADREKARRDAEQACLEQSGKFSGGHSQHQRNCEPERLGSVAVDDEFELRRLLHRQVGRLIDALEDGSGVEADLTIYFYDVGAVAHQPPSCDSGANRISRRNLVTRRQGDKLLAAALEKGITRDKEDIIRVDIIPAVVRQPRKRRIDLVACAGVENLYLQPDGTGCVSNAPQCFVSARTVGWIDENSHAGGLRRQRMQEFQPLGRQLLNQIMDAGSIAARSGEARLWRLWPRS